MIKKNGFTLIELLVVIIIIAILSTIGITLYRSSLQQTRMAKRISDLEAIKNALELYYQDNQHYPDTGSVWFSECTVTGVTTKSSSDQVIPGLVPKYMAAFPSDPQMNKSVGVSCYLYRSDGTDYKLRDDSVSEFFASDYLSQRNLVDPARDGCSGSCSAFKVDGANPSAWAVYSSCDPDNSKGSCAW